MGYEVEHLGDTGILFGHATPPFSVAELIEQVKEVRRGDRPSISFGMPMIADLRLVRLTELSADSLRELVSIRRGPATEADASFQAFIVGDRGSFGMVRVYIAHSNLRGLRPEGYQFVSTSPVEVAAWMADRLAPDGPDAGTIARAIEAHLAARGG